MTNSELAEQKRVLYQLAKEISGDGQSIEIEAGRFNEDLASVHGEDGVGEHVAHQTEKELEFILWNRCRGKLQEIEGAIERIESGNYEKCAICGQAIGVARLKALPFVDTCILCQGNTEPKRDRDIFESAGRARFRNSDD